MSRPRTRVVCAHEDTGREQRPERFVVELEDGRREPFGLAEIETARWVEMSAFGLPETGSSVPSALDGMEVPHLAGGIMIVGRAKSTRRSRPMFTASAAVNSRTGHRNRDGRLILLPCPGCRRSPRVSEVTLGRLLDGLYQLVQPHAATGRRTMTLRMIEDAQRML